MTTPSPADPSGARNLALLRTLERALNGQLKRRGGLLRRVPFAEVAAAWDRRETGLEPSPTTIVVPPLQREAPAYGPAEQAVLAALARLAATEPAVQHVLLHGSLASRDFTGYADVDALLVVDDAVCTDAAAFAQARRSVRRALRAVLRYDVLQHHGFHVVPASLLRGYPEAYLPRSVWRTMVAVGTPAEVSLTLRGLPAPVGPRGVQALVHTLQAYPAPPADAYRAKLFLSMFMLLPALALQAVGKETDKAHSFGTLAAHFAEAAWAPMAWATAMRQAWPRRSPGAVDRLVLEGLNPWMASRTVLRRYPVPAPVAAAWTPAQHADLLAFAARVAAWVAEHPSRLAPESA